MASKKSTPKAAEVVTPANTFEAELELIVASTFKDAPEFKGAFEDEFAILKERLIGAHKAFLKQEIAEKDKQLEETLKVVSLMEQDINSLKTTVLRMAVTQYGN
jgi:hypothetical protein